MLGSSFGDPVSTTAIFLPSGDQLSGPSPTSANFLSPPPSGLTRDRMLRSPEARRKAIWRPSGDHTGDQSTAGSVVNRLNPVPPTSLT